MQSSMKNDILKKFSKDSLIYLPGQLFIGISGFLCIIIYTRLFNPYDFGNYSLISGAVGFLITVLTGWMSQSALRYYDDFSDKKTLISTIAFTFSLINFFTLLVGTFLIFLFKDSMEQNLLKLIFFGLILFSVQSLYTVIKSFLRSERKTKAFSFNDIFLSICQVFLVLIIVNKLHLNVESILISLIIGYSVSIVVSVYILKLHKYYDPGIFDWNIMKELLRYGFPLLGITFTTWVLTLSDRYIIKIFGSTVDVGVYTINYSVAYNIFNLFITLLMMGAYPLIIKTWNSSGKKATELVVSDMIKYFLMITIPAFFGVLSLSKEIMTVFGTEEYVTGHKIMPIIALGMLFLGVSQYVIKIWELQKNTKIILYLNIFIAVVNIILNIILIPLYGYIFAAVTTTISYILYFIVSIYKAKRIFKLHLSIFNTLNILLSSFIMFLIITFIEIEFDSKLFSLISIVIMGVIVYLSILLFLEFIRHRYSKFK
ncbi:lipopolysaccharide biosynthesis protein [Ornithinibacillus gellani]|uniref:lipopolysaccharide biosynthesis protein n=1 Tax=Ornithinibacillus gellani TaxID=2293253 RepID=UPI000F4906F5|nr:lipopolysaccharide biosynthesis protein [Ornithinibacillus gellani]TQS71164.1 lipopolysaccharide biosynthesis protein [Ornithinibacillus gellani]